VVRMPSTIMSRPPRHLAFSAPCVRSPTEAQPADAPVKALTDRAIAARDSPDNASSSMGEQGQAGFHVAAAGFSKNRARTPRPLRAFRVFVRPRWLTDHLACALGHANGQRGAPDPPTAGKRSHVRGLPVARAASHRAMCDRHGWGVRSHARGRKRTGLAPTTPQRRKRIVLVCAMHRHRCDGSCTCPADLDLIRPARFRRGPRPLDAGRARRTPVLSKAG